VPLYRVIWIIDLDAESPEEAAKEALEIQREPGSTATVFEVTEWESGKTIVDKFERNTDKTITIDLSSPI
jgi:flavin-binding protein dodecin